MNKKQREQERVTNLVRPALCDFFAEKYAVLDRLANGPALTPEAADILARAARALGQAQAALDDPAAAAERADLAISRIHQRASAASVPVMVRKYLAPTIKQVQQ
ncbi:hypothetical protein ACUIAJ_03965 [Dermabacteraceae bacterium CCM 9519]